MRHERCRQLFGERFDKLRDAKILICGVGGVGGYALDCLYRTGITRITIVDNDRYELSNQNRQIGSEALGELKAEHLAKLYPGITPWIEWIDQVWVESLDVDAYDWIVDAIDFVPGKVALAQKASHKLISSMGSAKRIDPRHMRVDSIWNIHTDRFARKVQRELKRFGFAGDYSVVYSQEPMFCKELGSFVGVTGSFGLMICSLIIERLLERES